MLRPGRGRDQQHGRVAFPPQTCPTLKTVKNVPSDTWGCMLQWKATAETFMISNQEKVVSCMSV